MVWFSVIFIDSTSIGDYSTFYKRCNSLSTPFLMWYLAIFFGWEGGQNHHPLSLSKCQIIPVVFFSWGGEGHFSSYLLSIKVVNLKIGFLETHLIFALFEICEKQTRMRVKIIKPICGIMMAQPLHVLQRFPFCNISARMKWDNSIMTVD